MLRRYYCDKLIGRAYDAYCSIENAVRAYQSECMLYGVTAEEARQAAEAFLYDNPDVYYYAGQICDMRQESQGVRVRLNYHQCDDGKFSDALRKITEQLDKKITSYTTDYEVAKLVYEYLVETVEGETEPYQDYLRINPNNHRQQSAFMEKHGTSFSAYGAIVEKRAVCMGVAMAYKLILDRYRVEAACVAGTYQGAPHMMNVVEIEGQRAFVDVSKGLKDKDMPMVRYDMFLMDDKQTKKYFTCNEEFGCDGTCLNYFAKNKLQFKDGFSLRRYLNSFSYQKTKGEIRFFYSGKSLDDTALGKVIGDICPNRCGTEYDFVGYVVENGVGNCMIKKHED